ncbi:hypothetical protein HAX54_017959, partial [Datura stramonium]|nr:hypothetical protein [Datura stramonium]
KFNNKIKTNYDKVKLKNKWDSLKLIWKEWDTLVGKETSLGWDFEKKTIQENPNIEKFIDKGLQCRELMKVWFKDVISTGEHAWVPSSTILPDNILGSSWFQVEKKFQFEIPTNNEEAIVDDYLTNNTNEGLDQIIQEEPQ